MMGALHVGTLLISSLVADKYDVLYERRRGSQNL